MAIAGIGSLNGHNHQMGLRKDCVVVWRWFPYAEHVYSAAILPPTPAVAYVLFVGQEPNQ